MKTFDVPRFYKSPFITRVKEARRILDPRKRDLSPAVLDFGPVRFKLARHFGFCYGVENAIDIAYRAIEENPERRIFLLSEMIHNPHVNADLVARGVRFLRTTEGEPIIPLDTLGPDDVVIIPAFGATLEVMARLRELGVDPMTYNTTCPFVEKVWKKSEQIGAKGYSVVVHGKRYHEETRATFSHAKEDAPVVVVRDLDEARLLGDVIAGRQGAAFFYERFADRHSEGFDVARDLDRIGVVNQTTMLASETQAIADHLRDVMVQTYGEGAIGAHFADTSRHALLRHQREPERHARPHRERRRPGDRGGRLQLVEHEPPRRTLRTGHADVLRLVRRRTPLAHHAPPLRLRAQAAPRRGRMDARQAPVRHRAHRRRLVPRRAA